MRYKRRLIEFTVLVLLASCELSPFEEDANPVPVELTSVEKESALFEADGQDKIFTFRTNDTKYLTENGYTLWTVPLVNKEESFSPLTVEATKESGRSEAGYGVVFCEQEIEEKPFMLTVLINANGFYTVGKISDGVFSHINNGWQSFSYINTGFGIKNTISIAYANDTKNFALKINGYETTTFAVSEEITFTNSRSGYVAVIANNENFPSNPVKVTFENVSP